MEATFSHLGLWPVVNTVAGIAIFSAVWLYFTQENAPAVPFQVDVPAAVRNPTTDLEVLEDPSIHITGSTVLQCYCPANGKLLGRINPHTAEGIDRAIGKAAEAQIEWAKTSFRERRRVLRTLLKHILDNQDDIVKAACLDSGKTRVDASFGEVLVTTERLAWTIKHGEKALRPDRRPTNNFMFYKHNEVRYEPLGVVAACVSWNYPFHNLLGPIISSIFAGNAIVVKSSELTAWSAQYYVSIVRGALAACGHSPALVQAVTCWPNVAPHLTSHPDIAHITFIGSRPVAHHVLTSAAKSLTPVCVELGGKDPAIILDDASNLEKVSSILMRGVFQSAGQNCIGIERVIALPDAYTRLLTLIPSRIAALRIGSALDDEESVDMGSLISSSSFSRLESLINDAVSQGAKLLCGGKRYTHPTYPNGHYFLPTLLAEVTPSMPIAQEELFAPVFLLMRAPSLAHAISIANSTPYSLGASVFGSDAASLDRVVREIRAGMVAVNDFGSYYICSLPFGGVGGSGYGRFAGEEGLRGVSNAKSVCRDRFWGVISTGIPDRLDYAAAAATAATGVKSDGGGDDDAGGKKKEKRRRNAKLKAWEFAKGIVRLGYGLSLAERVRGLVGIAKNA